MSKENKNLITILVDGTAIFWEEAVDEDDFLIGKADKGFKINLERDEVKRRIAIRFYPMSDSPWAPKEIKIVKHNILSYEIASDKSPLLEAFKNSQSQIVQPEPMSKIIMPGDFKG